MIERVRPVAYPGKGTTFYSWLDVPSTASTPEIARAYRKKSVQLQCVLDASRASLSLEADRLRLVRTRTQVSRAHMIGSQGLAWCRRFCETRRVVNGTPIALFNSGISHERIRYDFFYKNGVPRWRGTGYYYARFRPGLGVSNVKQVMVILLN